MKNDKTMSRHQKTSESDDIACESRLVCQSAAATSSQVPVNTVLMVLHGGCSGHNGINMLSAHMSGCMGGEGLLLKNYSDACSMA